MNNKIYDIVYHLSDTDLDGYGSQYLMSLTNENIKFYNARVKTMNEEMNKIFFDILQNKDKKILFLITDLSLDEKKTKKMNSFKKGNKNIDITYQLLDHHYSNSGAADDNSWYHFDNDKCSAKLTSDYILSNYSFEYFKGNHIRYIGEFIDSHDRWLIDSQWHNKANYLSDIVFNLKYIEELEHLKREHIFFYIEKISKYLCTKDIYSLELTLKELEYEYLEDKITPELFHDNNCKYEHKLFFYFAREFEKIESETLLMNYKGEYKFKLFYNMNSTIFQYLSHYYLDNNKDIEFLINIKQNGIVGLRGQAVTPDDEHLNLGLLAKNLLSENETGGGHPGAAGCFIDLKQKINSKSEMIKALSNKFYQISII